MNKENEKRKSIGWISRRVVLLWDALKFVRLLASRLSSFLRKTARRQGHCPSTIH